MLTTEQIVSGIHSALDQMAKDRCKIDSLLDTIIQLESNNRVLRDEITDLVFERDSVRECLCHIRALQWNITPQDYADRCGWDCFTKKEHKNDEAV